MPKNGSTSIQVGFLRNRERLRARGICMPTVGDRFVHPFHLRALLAAPDPDRAAARKPRVAEALAAIDAAVATRPEILFLSSEALALGCPSVETVRTTLRRWSHDVDVVAYMRDPVSLYRSIVQHHVRSQHRVPAPGAWSTGYREVIATWTAGFGDRFTAARFERGALFNGSVVDDIVHRCDPRVAAEESFDPGAANASEVAEVSAVMQAYMAEHHPGRKVYGPETGNVRRWLTRIARAERVGTPCRLKDEVAGTILALGRDELRELDDAHGLRFDAIDYDALNGARVHEACLDADRIEDLCVTDPAVVALLTDALNTRYLPRWRKQAEREEARSAAAP